MLCRSVCILHGAHSQSQKKMLSMHHLHLDPKPFVHQVEYRALDSKVPNKRYRFGLQLVQRVLKLLLSNSSDLLNNFV